MIGGRLFSLSSDRSRLAVQTAALAALLLVRFLVHKLGYFVYAPATYALSCVFFLTIPAEERPLYHLTLPGKKIIKAAIFVALLCMASNVAMTYFCFDGRFMILPNSPRQVLIFAFAFPLTLIGMVAYHFFLMGGLLEEFLFRGFFWGYLRKFQVSDFLILCISAILFWVAHYYYIPTPGIWIRVLVSGLIFGAVAWKTRSLFMAALVHACWNSSEVLFRGFD
jgi:membrane protease YdiL (CAAX protease family)